MIDEGSILFLLYIINKSTSLVACSCMSGFCLGLCYGQLCLIKKQKRKLRQSYTYDKAK